MSEFNLTYPTPNNQQEAKTIKSGELLFLVGANGSGKSTLMHEFAKQNYGKVRRIAAHRQVWFNSNAMNLTPASREQNEKNISSQDRQEQSRYRDDYAAMRSQVTIFDLIDSENVEARRIGDAARSGNMALVEELAREQAPLSKMNDILRISNLDISILAVEGSKLMAVRGSNPPYSIAELSDGERNALLIIANVLTAPPNTLILLDEPERHLHRSIVSPLISTLLGYREDLAFVVSTHDVLLPLDQNSSSALLSRIYNHRPRSWTIDYIESVQELDEDIAAAVLGSRRKILFIEGLSSSLDLQIYQILFPEVTIKSAGSCTEVEKIVKGLNSSSANHWVKAVGIIDRDNRSLEECQELLKCGIVALDHYSVESIYYHPTVVASILDRVAEISDIDKQEALSEIEEAIVSAANAHQERLSARMTQRNAANALQRLAPDWKEIQSNQAEIAFSTNDLYDQQSRALEQLIADRDHATIVSRYPMRETQALGNIARVLGFVSREKYEQAVRKMLIDCEDQRTEVLTLINTVESALN
ncbi:MAG: AAA family ATPase [Verrucomicrobiota bacterium]